MPYALLVSYYPAKPHVTVWTIDAAGRKQQGTDLPVTFGQGDQFGARARAKGVVSVYRNGMLNCPT